MINEAPYDGIVQAAAKRLDMTPEKVDEVLDVYMDESRKEKERRKKAKELRCLGGFP